MKIKINRAKTPSTELYVKRVGDTQFGVNKPVAFILPGGPGADHTGYLRYACLQDIVDVLFHDPRGCGESDTGDVSTYTMDNYIDDIESIREHFNLKKIIVIGKSYGSMCALGYALRYPHSVNQLILAAGAPSYRFLETAKTNIHRMGTHDQIEVCEKLWAGKLHTQQELLNFFDLTNSLYSVKARHHPEEFNLQNKSLHFSCEVLNEGFLHSFWNFDYEAKLSTIHCPTLILAGREDWINDVSYAEMMAKQIPKNELKIFENASHSMETDVTEMYFQTIRDFIVRHCS